MKKLLILFIAIFTAPLLTAEAEQVPVQRITNQAKPVATPQPSVYPRPAYYENGRPVYGETRGNAKPVKPVCKEGDLISERRGECLTKPDQARSSERRR